MSAKREQLGDGKNFAPSVCVRARRPQSQEELARLFPHAANYSLVYMRRLETTPAAW